MHTTRGRRRRARHRIDQPAQCALAPGTRVLLQSIRATQPLGNRRAQLFGPERHGDRAKHVRRLDEQVCAARCHIRPAHPIHNHWQPLCYRRHLPGEELAQRGQLFDRLAGDRRPHGRHNGKCLVYAAFFIVKFHVLFVGDADRSLPRNRLQMVFQLTNFAAFCKLYTFIF